MYVIRADGNAKIGAGHLMRCLTIAEKLAEQLGSQEEICFLCADDVSADMVRKFGFPVRVLNTDYRDMESELPTWQQLWVGEEKQLPLVILVDSYYVTDAYLSRLGEWGKVFLLDDMQQHAYPVDAVINYNAFADEMVYERLYESTSTECIVGSQYVPIRQQFLNHSYEVKEEVKHVLITTGGGDVDNIAGQMVKKIYREGVTFHLVTGRYNPHLEQLKQMEQKMPDVLIHHDVSDMAGLMAKCDIAVTAGGTTIYELATVGVPFLCFSYAENQEALTEYIEIHDIAGFLGAYHKQREAVLEQLQIQFEQLCNQPELRRDYSQKERKLIDGKGAERLAGKLIRER